MANEVRNFFSLHGPEKSVDDFLEWYKAALEGDKSARLYPGTLELEMLDTIDGHEFVELCFMTASTVPENWLWAITEKFPDLSLSDYVIDILGGFAGTFYGADGNLEYRPVEKEKLEKMFSFRNESAYVDEKE